VWIHVVARRIQICKFRAVPLARTVTTRSSFRFRALDRSVGVSNRLGFRPSFEVRREERSAETGESPCVDGMDSKPTSGVGTATVASALAYAADFVYEIKIVLKSVLYKHVAPFRWCAGRLL